MEIESAAEALQRKGWEIKMFTGNDCNEEAIKNISGPDILHIATHGYYISDADTAGLSYALQQNPYLRSGLILGMVNSNKKNMNDNVLTAYEVMNLNLKNTSLVVLSACESAKGEVKPGQGVYGIQRAFKIAGAKNVLVAVKDVDDKATQLLMKYFYTNVASGDSYTEALKKAQMQMINHPLFKDPKYWDGFILIGQ
jgi:CHAT domain-containing protein